MTEYNNVFDLKNNKSNENNEKLKQMEREIKQLLLERYLKGKEKDEENKEWKRRNQTNDMMKIDMMEIDNYLYKIDNDIFT